MCGPAGALPASVRPGGRLARPAACRRRTSARVASRWDPRTLVGVFAVLAGPPVRVFRASVGRLAPVSQRVATGRNHAAAGPLSCHSPIGRTPVRPKRSARSRGRTSAVRRRVPTPGAARGVAAGFGCPAVFGCQTVARCIVATARTAVAECGAVADAPRLSDQGPFTRRRAARRPAAFPGCAAPKEDGGRDADRG